MALTRFRGIHSPSMSTLVELIAKKRDGNALSEAEIGRVVSAFVSGEMPDYQMSAFLMAVFFRDMEEGEMVALTEAMLHSGEVLRLDGVSGIKVDKHSTGGVGDKVSLALAPLVASCGVPVPMVAGRGLGHTGGTLDKLEAIPGFRVDLDAADFARIVSEVGCAIIGQTREIAPADKRIYALRDVTATVESIPLIVASILSKKLAEGIDGLVLDVKVGKGAFMGDLERARALGEALVRTGTRAGKEVVALLTDMSAPLGRTIGNALETREALDLLRGGGPPDLRECTFALGSEMLRLGRKASSDEEARAKLSESIRTGRAARLMERMIEAQGGDPRVVSDPKRLPEAPVKRELSATSTGYLATIDPLALGLAAVAMGAGRTRVDQSIDPAVGIELLVSRGDEVRKGAPLVRLHTSSEQAARDLEARVLGAFEIAEAPPAPTPLILDRLTARA